MRTTKLDMMCPWCGRQMDRVSSVNLDAVPEEGDITLCFGCGEWCVFDDGLHLRKPSDEEFDIIGSDPDMMKARWAWTETIKRMIKEKAVDNLSGEG